MYLAVDSKWLLVQSNLPSYPKRQAIKDSPFKYVEASGNQLNIQFQQPDYQLFKNKFWWEYSHRNLSILKPRFD
jgi:hypothetical protein